jgi:hypothetical protein
MKKEPQVSIQPSGQESGGKHPGCAAKQQGEVAESAFLHKAESLGFSVSKPWGDSERYDLIVDSGAHRWRVQIKSTARSQGQGYVVHVCAVRHARGRGRSGFVPYTAKEIDILAAYIVPRDAWYVFPIQVLGRRTVVWLCPDPDHRPTFSTRYREAWCLMACARKGPYRKHIQVEHCCHLGTSHPGEKRAACPLRTITSKPDSQEGREKLPN